MNKLSLFLSGCLMFVQCAYLEAKLTKDQYVEAMLKSKLIAEPDAVIYSKIASEYADYPNLSNKHLKKAKIKALRATKNAMRDYIKACAGNLSDVEQQEYDAALKQEMQSYGYKLKSFWSTHGNKVSNITKLASIVALAYVSYSLGLRLGFIEGQGVFVD